LRSSVKEFHQLTEGAAGGEAWDFFFGDPDLLFPRPEEADAVLPAAFPFDFDGVVGVLSGMFIKV
jgi:hypothetical protein